MTATHDKESVPTLEAIYVASRASIPERGIMWRQLRNEGIPITSSWIDEDGEGATADFVDLWDRIHNEIAAASALVLYAEREDFPLKGALIEAGIALGMRKPVIVCLPDLGALPRNYRPVGSWIAHPLVSRRDDIRQAVELASRSRVSSSAVAQRVEADQHAPIYADGYCARCSELSYPLTRALEKTGVPTGENNWQQSYGPNKVRALADLETCLRRLLFALDEGKPEEIKERITRANHYIEFHAAVRRRLTALAQERHSGAATTPAPAEETQKGWQYTHERDAELIRKDGMMCEAHPGLEFGHDPNCAGPGMAWAVEGRTAIQSLLSGAAPTPLQEETKK